MSDDKKINVLLLCTFAIILAGIFFGFINAIIKLMNWLTHFVIDYIAYVVVGIIVLIILKKMLTRRKKK
jgi:hypothetical protein